MSNGDAKIPIYGLRGQTPEFVGVLSLWEATLPPEVCQALALDEIV